MTHFDWSAPVDTCQECGEEETPQDPLGHFQHPSTRGTYVMAHGQCGEDAGLELA